jgi:hypothetical protein
MCSLMYFSGTLDEQMGLENTNPGLRESGAGRVAGFSGARTRRLV